MKYIILGLVGIAAAYASFAHGGGLDRFGGHWNHKTGTYHYHQAR